MKNVLQSILAPMTAVLLVCGSSVAWGQLPFHEIEPESPTEADEIRVVTVDGVRDCDVPAGHNITIEGSEIEMELFWDVAPPCSDGIILVERRDSLGNLAPGEYTLTVVTWTRSQTIPLVVLESPSFTRGDANADGSVDISDAIATLGFLFLGQEELSCQDAADANDDGTLDISDAVATLGALFLGQGPIPPPGIKDCGLDPTPDEVTCEEYLPCEEP